MRCTSPSHLPGSWLSGPSSKPASGCRRRQMFEYVVSGIVAALLLVYLGWAMFRPEAF
jgi:K+-transporting ATPase KdpF subunit